MTGISTYERFALVEARKAGLEIRTYATRFDMVMGTVECGSFGDPGMVAVYGSDDHLKAVQKLRASLEGVEARIIEHRADVLADVEQEGGES